MLSQCLVPSITGELLVGSGTATTSSPSKIFIKVFQCILKSIKTFLIQNCTNAKKIQVRQKNPGQILI